MFNVNLKPNTTFNIAVADPNCGIYVGLKTSIICGVNLTQGFRYYTKTHGVRTIFIDTKVTTGLAFDEQTQILYFLDGCTKILAAFNWNPTFGNLCNFKFRFIY